MTWSLATYQLNGAVGVAALREDGTLVAPPDLKRWTTTLDVLEDWAHAEPVLRAIDVEDAPVIDYDRLLAPLRWPRKVICAGVNYRRHVREMGGEVPPDGWKPFFFLKPPTTTVIGPADAITVRAPGTARYDWEAELAAVIGIGGREIPSEDALGHLAGYCVANDVTARGHHKRDNVPADAFVYDWFAAKSIDGSLPLGPGITPAFQIPDPQNLRVRLWVNDELQQDESTSDMICTVAELISAASALVTLEPGDVISTGTPSGVGAGRGLYLVDGDVVRTTIDGLGTLRNPVIEPSGRTS
ncbi:MAG TPA: fumarylacetoacetate hydrolase family protein [Kribbellaceae bacterium]|nr:fumarylacetoacetate hydrolase family protein [Kribbellaceae bacterium]